MQNAPSLSVTRSLMQSLGEHAAGGIIDGWKEDDKEPIAYNLVQNYFYGDIPLGIVSSRPSSVTEI